MYSLTFLGITSVILALVLTPLARNLARYLGLVDQPDQHRKIHMVPIPRVGGVAIFASVLCAYALLLAVGLSSGHIVRESLPLVVRLVPAIAMVFAVGLIDDIVTVQPWIKFSGQLAAAIYAWSSGIRVNAFAGHPFVGAVSFLVTIFWIVLCANAINLIDGVDGLAAGVSLFAALTMTGAALLTHNFSMALVVVPLAGALIGFLRYNFHPASVFLGDSGSLTLGFLFGCFGAVWSEKSATVLGLTAPLLVLAVPILDVGTSIVRRVLRGRPIFSADRAHIHHKLLALGLAPRHVVLVIYCICIIGSASALLLTVCHDRYRGFVIVIVCLAAWLGLQHLGYSEFNVAGRVVFGGAFRRVLSAQFALEQFEHEVREEQSFQKCWESLCRACPKFGFSGAVLDLDDGLHCWGIDAGWQIRIDFPGHGHIKLWRESGANGSGTSAVLFVDSVTRAFQEKLVDSESMKVRSGAASD
jgi:UDP-GlcNAc:undecaprenyl-phosphate/decaprenyl-phosphate GlcNAc-1-phosphate transferase